MLKSDENTYPKGRSLMQMYRVVPQRKRGNWCHSSSVLALLTTNYTGNTMWVIYFTQSVQWLWPRCSQQ